MSDNECAPDIDPVLSSGAMKLRKRKLDTLPWDHTGRHPGNPLFWNVILVMLEVAWKYIFRSRFVDDLPPHRGGRILSSIHINGLVDPLSLVLSQDKRVISMGRHDLMTMPLIGWVSRRMGSQPVIRRPEINLGVAEEEYARNINHRTLLTMTNCVAAGHNAVVMPEGKSHQDSHLHRFKTGPMRFVINASAIASQRGKPLAAMQPVGLHYRRHYWFRTDIFVEFIEPIIVEPPEEPAISLKLIDGEWVEPPRERVNSLRAQLFNSLSEITPDAPDWETYRSWQLIGHIRANHSGTRLASFREEVLATREIRNMFSRGQLPDSALSHSKEAAEILDNHGLDGRSVTDAGLSSERLWGKLLKGLFLMAATALITITSTGIQAFFAWYLGDRTDEGIDARTTYHMLAAMFSPVLLWPPITLVLAYLLHFPIIHPLIVPFSVAAMLLFHLSNLLFLHGYDCWNDFSDSVRRTRLADSNEGRRLEELLIEIRNSLNLL